MSLCATYVCADDGKFYKNPTYRDPSGKWFVCFDDDDPPELVVSRDHTGEHQSILVDLLGEDGFKKMRKGRGGQRCFDETGQFRPARAYFFHLLKRPPPPTDHRGVFEELPHGDLVFFDPEKE
jgi:hypothetical protein